MSTPDNRRKTTMARRNQPAENPLAEVQATDALGVAPSPVPAPWPPKVNGRAAKGRRKAQEPAVEPVQLRRAANPATVQRALELAGGDSRRIRYNRDGSITIVNNPGR